jgi:hypothetical protein
MELSAVIYMSEINGRHYTWHDNTWIRGVWGASISENNRINYSSARAESNYLSPLSPHPSQPSSLVCDESYAVSSHMQSTPSSLSPNPLF